MLILTHNAAAGGESVCLVGKGIVYDTGGLSIKNTLGMCGMKVLAVNDLEKKQLPQHLSVFSSDSLVLRISLRCSY
jgi:hypothetical protein